MTLLAPKIKICGITDLVGHQLAVKHGAHMVGFIFYKGSARYIAPKQAWGLANETPISVKNIGLFVNASLAEIEDVMGLVPLDYIQLHGDESLDFVRDVKKRTGMRIIKAFGVSNKDDLKNIDRYSNDIDMILLDKKAESGSVSGGSGTMFDWSIIEQERWQPLKPLMVAGGLTADNVGKAIRMTSPNYVDVCSGTESAKGIKSAVKIDEFMTAIQNAVT